MTYFGILKAGATAIPIDPASSVEEIVNFAKAGEASAVVLSPKLASENPDLRDRITEGGVNVNVWTFDEVFEMHPGNGTAVNFFERIFWQRVFLESFHHAALHRTARTRRCG